MIRHETCFYYNKRELRGVWIPRAKNSLVTSDVSMPIRMIEIFIKLIA